MKRTNGLRRLFAFLTAMLVLLSCVCTTSFAGDGMEGTSSLTVSIGEQNIDFSLYQIFSGDLAKVTGTETKTLINIDWGASMQGHEAELVAALKAETLADGSQNILSAEFADATTDAEDIASRLISVGSSAENADAFAQIVGNVLVGKDGVVTRTANSGTVAATNSGRYHAVFSNIADGYYFVTQNTNGDDTQVYSKYMLKIAGPSTVDAKRNSAPTLNKQIVTSDEGASETVDRFDEAAIGDTVTFKLTSEVPSMDGYTKYFYVVKDELSKGLTFDGIQSITIGGETIYDKATLVEDSTETKWYQVSTTDDGADIDLENEDDSAFKIVFNNFKQYTSEDEVIIYYTATVNTNAVVGKASDNVNMAKLEYSNNPNYNYKGENEPTDEDKNNGGISSTPWQNAYVYTSGINLIKVDGVSDDRLAGAKFKIEGTRLNTVILKNYTYTPVAYMGTSDVPSDATLYYMHNDGAFTTTAITDENKADYELEYVMYDKDGSTFTMALDGGYYHDTTHDTYVDEIVDGDTYEQNYYVYISEETEDNTQVVTKEENVSYEGTVGTNGVLEINGLGAGDYTITEIKAPTGYNLLDKPINISIKFTTPTSGSISSGCTWRYQINLNDGSAIDTYNTNNAIGTYDLKVKNNMGSTLPSTGGIGTRIFYGVGSVLLIGAAVLLITKKRMSVEND